MAIQGYTRPSLEVHQNLAVTENATAGYLNAAVIGPNFDVYRYGEEDLAPTQFEAGGQTIPYVFTTRPDCDYAVDLNSVKVNAEGLEALLANLDAKSQLDAADNFCIRTDGLVAATDGSALLTELHGLGVQVGDVVYAQAAMDSAIYRRTVVGLAGKKTPSVASAPSASPFNVVPTGKTAPSLSGASADIAVDASTNYTGAESTNYVLELVTLPTDINTSWAGAVFRVTDSVGIDLVQHITLTADATVSVGTMGLKVKFAKNTANMGLTVGNSFSIACTAAGVSSTQFDGILLDGIPVDIASFDRSTKFFRVEVRKPYTGPIPSDDAPDAAWRATEAGVVCNANAGMYLKGRTSNNLVPFVTEVGSLFVSFRVLVIPPATEDVFLCASREDITTYFGTITPENELAYGAAAALQGSTGRAIYAVRTRGTDVESFQEAWKKTETNSSMYVFGVISNDPEVCKEINRLNLSVSTPQVMRWRMTAIGADTSGEYTIAERDAAGNILTATISDYGTEGNVLVQVAESNDFSFLNVNYKGSFFETHAGDKIVMFGQSYTIRKVLTGKEVILSTGPDTAVTVAQPIALVKADTAMNAVEYLSAEARQYASRRTMLAWCDGGVDQGGNKVSGRFLACYIAGLRSAMLPQQGMTMTEVDLIAQAPKMYTKYTQAQLNDIAANGVMIITQESKGGPVFIRHQLTTDTDHGNLYYEASVTSNVDNISYRARDVLQGYVGKANVTPSALAAAKTGLTNTYLGFTMDATNDLVGNSLVDFQDLQLGQDPEFYDRVVAKVTLSVPLPLNNIKLYESVIAAQVTMGDAAS